MGSLGHTVSKVEAKAMITEIDTDGSNTGGSLLYLHRPRRTCIAMGRIIE